MKPTPTSCVKTLAPVTLSSVKHSITSKADGSSMTSPGAEKKSVEVHTRVLPHETYAEAVTSGSPSKSVQNSGLSQKNPTKTLILQIK